MAAGIPCCMLYSRPIMELVETHLLDAKASLWSFKNWFLRTSIRCFYIAVLGLVAAAFPFFGKLSFRITMLPRLSAVCAPLAVV